MAIDMRLISVKDGGTFAMNWVAGTNPKALHSNFQRAHIFAVDVSEKCEEIMAIIKSKENKLSFRILFKLFFGTIHIFAEQVQHLYCVTQNAVCFNTFVMKQYSRKRTSSMTTDNNSKRRRLESSDRLDITSLLKESEIFNNYSEEKFKFPKEIIGSSKKKIKTSTCIEIQQIHKITIRQISWDNPHPEEEGAFGDATQDDRMILLSELSVDDVVTEQTPRRKRKSSNEKSDCSPFKKPNNILNESIDDIRCSPSTCNDTMSDFSVDLRDQRSTEAETSISNPIQTGFTQNELMSASQSIGDQLSRIALHDLNEIPTSENLPEVVLNNETSTIKIVSEKPALKRKRGVIIDNVKQISTNYMKTLFKDVWVNCYNRDKKEHIAQIKKYKEQPEIIEKAPSRRFRSAKLLFSFKSNLKRKLRQNDDVNRQLMIVEILGEKYESCRNDFKTKPKEKIKATFKKSCEPCKEEIIEEFQAHSIEINDNIPTETDQNNNIFQQSNINCQSGELVEDVAFLKCSLDKIDLRKISFDFPAEAGTQRSEWGKDGILLKLLDAWKTQNPIINMNTIIVGANRINAALAFRTLLDLAGQQYIEIVKDNNHSIESIKMGREMIRQLNITYTHVK